MAKVLLLQPWQFRSERHKANPYGAWRNGPYSLVLLGGILKKEGHEVKIVDLECVLHSPQCSNNPDILLSMLDNIVKDFTPDIVGVSFFSIHWVEVKRMVQSLRNSFKKYGIQPLLVAGGIHATSEPQNTLEDLGFDYVFIGEADTSIIKLANGQDPKTIPGVYEKSFFHSHDDKVLITNNPGKGFTSSVRKGEEIENLDDLPFIDWTMCDYNFYSHPSHAIHGKVNSRTRSLDLMMTRGCVFKCKFCAYSFLSKMRTYSGEYLFEQVKYLVKTTGVRTIYFTDSTVGNGPKALTTFSELMASSGLGDQVHWMTNIRANQISEKRLKLMWNAGCRLLLYGFESGSQRILDNMKKQITVERNIQAAEMHNRLKFPYFSSIMFGNIGETEEEIRMTIDFMKHVKPPRCGVNCYVPLPGSPDYDELKAAGRIDIKDPRLWREIGEVNSNRIYADIDRQQFMKLFSEANAVANSFPNWIPSAWNDTKN